MIKDVNDYIRGMITEQGYTQPWGIKLHMSTSEILKYWTSSSLCSKSDHLSRY